MKDIFKEQSEKTEKRMLYINESFQNIKGIKLYGWENKFLDHIEGVHQEEIALEDLSLFRNRIFDFVTNGLSVSLPLLVYGLYVYMGNSLDLVSMALVNVLMSKIQDRMQQINRIYKNLFSLDEAMVRLNDFYTAPEVQKGLIKRIDLTESTEYALTV